MGNIFRVELFRYFKSKYCKLLFLMSACIPLLASLLLVFLKNANQQSGAIPLTVTPRLLLPFLFGYSSVFLFVSLFLQAMFLVQDFSCGTVVNKLYCGYSRLTIFGGTLLFHLFVTLVVNLLFGVFYLTFSSLLLSDYSIGWGTGAYYLGVHLAATLFSAVLIFGAVFVSQKSVLGIVLAVAILYIGFFIAGMGTEVHMAAEKSSVIKTIFHWLPHFQTADIFYGGGLGALVSDTRNSVIPFQEHLMFWISTPVYSAIVLFFSGLKFRNSDIRII